MLHVAPERCFRDRFQHAVGDGYLTADFYSTDVMEKMDVTDIRHKDGTFDIIYCSHVLEHVPDDKAAIREFRRVLKPDGWAVLMVPITSETIVEDPTIQNPKLRKELFGQEDHVRRYGLDFGERLKEGGFNARAYSAADVAAKHERESCRLAEGEWVFRCTP